ncbi:hypothetical protein D6853_09050 [Butyrivibrio sp. X503]|uniref:hypothetical protein n=1 Tax=Butyrivibrio sp. X503 TaxID=2364878 RepID=UPI000EA958EA|nr:hypothetical protein [Butyrivibrio sp. X503]RKM55691.1 hypothetical protein D6853_09050 [Butyrivibrio sp. X503]
MFKLKFHASSSNEVYLIELDDGSYSSSEIAEIKPALNKLMIENPCLTFARKHKAGYFENVPSPLVNDIAFITDSILGDCWQYCPVDTPEEAEKPDIRPYIGALNLINSLLNHSLQSYRRILELEDTIKDFRNVYGDLPSEIFGES